MFPGVTFIVAATFMTAVFKIEICQSFIVEPQNTTAFENDTVTFACSVNALIRPHWMINGILHNFHNLPDRYTYNRTNLILRKVLLSDADNIYQCVLLNISGIIGTSRSATLTVLEGSPMKEMKVSFDGNQMCFNSSHLRVDILCFTATIMFTNTQQTGKQFTCHKECDFITSHVQRCRTLEIDMSIQRTYVESPPAFRYYRLQSGELTRCRIDDSNCCQDSTISGPTPITTEDKDDGLGGGVISAFVVIGFGVVAVLIAFIVAVIYFRCSRKRAMEIMEREMRQGN